jgi:hypothetical protein
VLEEVGSIIPESSQECIPRTSQMYSLLKNREA